MDRQVSVRQMIVFVLIASILSTIVTAGVIFGWNTFHPTYDLSFDPASVDAQNIRKFRQVKEILKDDFYKDVNENELLEGAIGGLADSLKDPYTVYFNKEQMQSFLEKSEGSYVGIGVHVNMDDKGLLTIVEPFEDSPAAMAGMKQGDKITRVDGKDVTAIRDENMIISMIKGEENTQVKIEVFRPAEGVFHTFDLTRKRIKVSNINSQMLEGDIGYIRLVMFDQEIAKYFVSHLSKLRASGAKAVIIDLRDNPGGSYEQVVAIADRILPKGLIVYTEDRKKVKQEKLSDEADLDMPIAVLINGNSASASEILAGAIKDHNKGTLVGTKTFGKGLVQELKLLEDGSGLKVTISRYFTPSGVCIQGIGIKPDIEVDVMEEYKNMPVSQIPKNKDIQLKSAIEAIKADMNQP